MSMLAIYGLAVGFLITAGIVLCLLSYPYMTNTKHEPIAVNLYDVGDLANSTLNFIHIRLSTQDALTANNPIAVQVEVSMVDMDKIGGMDVVFEGAEKDFSKPEPPPEFPPYNSSMTPAQNHEARVKYMEDVLAYNREKIDTRNANALHLESNKNYTELVEQRQKILEFLSQIPHDPAQENVPLGTATFSGSMENLTYATGGKFDIKFSLGKRTSEGVAYNGQDPSYSYVLAEAVEVSPPEVLLQIKNNNLLTGLSYIAIGVAPLVAGFVGILEILKQFAFP